MLIRKIRFVIARIHEARALAAQKAGRADEATRLREKAEEIFRRIDEAPSAEQRADAGARAEAARRA